ncbi:transmembrane protein 41A-like [Liolophura sinensis]|uniref:transmembrane protein 41A-like n=1 Tax=Liolophura sinensis TaxID=3198878 RepID=UPI00315870F4
MAHIAWVPLIFVAGSLYLYYLSTIFPVSKNYTAVELKFPTTLAELQTLARNLHDYKTEHIEYVIFLFSSAYIYKQTFAIPGSVFMNLLAGALFGVWYGFPLVCLLTGIGATNCYLLSWAFGKPYIQKYFPDRVKSLQDKVDKNLDSLFFFLLFLRLFPMSPNWFLNMASPVLNIPIGQFFFSVLIGLMPYNMICVQTGCMVSELRSMNHVFTYSTLLKLAGLATVTLLPGYLIQRFKNHRLKLE